MSPVYTYLKIRKNILDRKLVEFGIHPVAAYVIVPLLFLLLSFLLFYKTQFALYIYMTYAIVSVAFNSERKKNDFLKLYFQDKDFRKLRVLENLLFIAPFALFLFFKMEWLAGIGLLAIAALLSFLRSDLSRTLYLPTPFGTYPYEFATGFRKLLPFYLGLVFLLAMAVLVSNFNLGLFALAIIPFLCMNFYADLENPFYVWIYDKSVQEFLVHKCLVSMLYLAILLFPFCLTLILVFPEMVKFTLVVSILTFLYLASYIIFKYVRFPKNFALGHVFLMAISYVFPPLLLFTLAYYLPKAKLNLKTYLK